MLIRKKVEEVAADPFAARNVKKLTDCPGYRLRVGDWWIIYDLDDGALVLLVIKLGPRGDVYNG